MIENLTEFTNRFLQIEGSRIREPELYKKYIKASPYSRQDFFAFVGEGRLNERGLDYFLQLGIALEYFLRSLMESDLKYGAEVRIDVMYTINLC
jgi:hypothetical protein